MCLLQHIELVIIQPQKRKVKSTFTARGPRQESNDRDQPLAMTLCVRNGQMIVTITT